MKKKVINILVIIFTIGVIYEVYNYVKELNTSNTNKVLEDIQISDNLKSSKQIAIKQQDVDFTWKDMGTSMDAWPDIDTFEYYGSECTDATGNNITPTTDVIQFNEQTQTATISTSKTIYCTLSFARRSTVLKLMQQTTNETYLKTVANNDELLRYVGNYTDVTYNADKDNPKSINNFICFGTENKDTCLNNKETYMYRIIGITTENVNANLGLTKDQLKIIKATPPSDGISIQWHSSTEDIKWDAAEVQKDYLNGTFLSSITGTVGTHQWSDLISNPKWYIADNTEATSSKSEKKKTTLSANLKIGLMYASDYYNTWKYGENTNSWLHIANGMTESLNTYRYTNEWTMTRYGYYVNYIAWYVESYGKMVTMDMKVPQAVRPVFYLTNEISISGGGTESDPFIISDRIL